MRRLPANLKDKNIIIATHVYTTGPAQDLRDYLINQKIKKILFVGHPLFYDKKLAGSGYEIYQNGKISQKKFSAIKKIPELLSYLKDIYKNIAWARKFGKSWDLYIGSDNLNAFSGIILKWLGCVKKTIYYVIDYNPHRFENKVINYLYHKVDQFCVKYSDETWNLSAVMQTARKKYFGFSGGNQIEVPVGVWFARIRRLPFSNIDKHKLVFMGHITKKQGIQNILPAIPLIKNKIADFKFLVVGGGPYLEELKLQVTKLALTKNVQFTGYVKNHQDIEKLLPKCALAIALYEKYDDHKHLTFTHFSDPAKIKVYLASGLPIILTNVPPRAAEIEKLDCGKIVNYNKKNIAHAVIALMENSDKLEGFRKNAVNYAKKYGWNPIFDKALSNLL